MSSQRKSQRSSVETQRAAKAFTRRTLLKGAAATGAIAATGPWLVENAFSSSGEVNVICWTGYLPDVFLADFEKETGIKPNVSPLGSNEELINKMKAAQGRGFDVVTPTLNRKGQWIDLKLTQPWDLSKIPNLSNVEPAFVDASKAWTWDGGQHHLPHIWGTEAMAWRTDLFQTEYGKLSLGATRGGTAKVAVLSSALFGSLSGSVISNVITTGSITIPAIKKSGYPSHYAGGIECAASTGGVLMPPVMGATAFVMAAFLSISYGKIALAAAIPSILAYIGLLIQVDGYAARQGLAGLSKSQIPSLKKVMMQGWFYLGAVAVLLYFLFAMRLESQAPFISILFLLAFAMIRKETRFTLRTFLQFIQSTGKLLSELIAILSGVGMILGALALTGVAAAFAREIVAMAGGNLLFMLILGAFASFVLGMGMTITACYVFLALVLAPALEMMGLNQIAVHLYVMYWGMLSYITPPVALAAYPAAVIAGSRPIKVGLVAMKLGAVKYLVPLFFVLDPALVMQAGTGAIIQAFISATIGVLLIGSVLEGYLIGLGRIELTTPGGLMTGVALFVSGCLLSLPGLKLDLFGLGLLILTISSIYIFRAAKKTDPLHSS